MKLCAIIPSYNHYKKLPSIVQALNVLGVSVIIIDDGSGEPAQTEVAKIKDCRLYRQDRNIGKGAAVIRGLHVAVQEGFTHALQLDADGQHDLSVLPHFIKLAKQHPKAVINGQAIYDHSVPLGRKVGRWITHVWVWIETLSFRIKDSMCGVRIYPLSAVMPLLDEEAIGKRMDFDTDILVRLFWRGVAPLSVPVPVVYPEENHSNFHIVKDNWRIIKMHARLVLTMLRRLPSILKHRPPEADQVANWSNLTERGVYYGLRLCAVICRDLGRTGQKVLLAPIVFFFFLTGRVQRQASTKFLTRVRNRKPSFFEVYKNFHNFGMRALDVFLAWTGSLPEDVLSVKDKEVVQAIMLDPKGGVLVIAHLGNVEVVRALIDKEIRSRITVLVHTKHAIKYNRIVEEGCGEASINLMQVTEIGPETIIALKERIEKGEWVVIAGDRVPVQSTKDVREHVVKVEFFGEDASFPQGPWVLASVLKCQVYALFCLWQKEKYHVTMEKLFDQVQLPRGQRKEEAQKYAANYAKRLEVECRKAPDQWYNFYDFWGQ